MDLKEKVRTLIETPMHLNLELIDNNILYCSENDNLGGARILQLI
jgi:hypothetical protein